MRHNRFSIIRRSLFAKFTISFILVGLIPLSVLGYMAFSKVTDQATRYTENQLSQMMLYLSENVEQKFSEFDNISKLMYTNTELYEQLLQALTVQSDYQGYDHSVVINDDLKTILSTNQYIRNVVFVSKDTNEIYAQSRTALKFDKNNFLWRKWSSDFNEHPKSLQYLSTHPESYFAGSSAEVFTLGRQFMDKATSVYANPPTMGILFFDIDLKAFDLIFDTMKLNQGDTVAILDKNGLVIYANKHQLWGSSYGEYAKNAGERASSTLTLEQPIPHTDFRMIGTFSKKELYSNLFIIRDWTSIVVAMSLMFLTILSLIFSRRLSKPIREIIRQMAKAESGNLELHVSVQSADEVGQLARGFNRMAVRLREFIQVAYLAEIKQKQAELNALKSQIRPHYLYNTLEVIRMSAVAYEVRPVADMIRSLSSQLEYVLDYGQNLVTVEQELEHVHHYFELIRVRYDDLIRLEVEGLSRVSTSWQVLKLSIQPLVENAVQHGLWPKPEGGQIRIRFDTKEDCWLIVSVIDDGVGMPASKLREIVDSLENQTVEHLRRHLGLKNVHDRLRSLFGSDSGLTVESRPGLGTIVRFGMPIQREEGLNVEAVARG